MFRILIVEDSQAFRKMLKKFLIAKSSSILVAEAENGGEATERVDSFCPDLILMDIRLPDESGLALTKRIKANYPMVRVIMLTSYDFPEYQEAAARYGADGFLVKGSITFEELLATINSFLPTS